jgi:hypothetical protein
LFLWSVKSNSFSFFPTLSISILNFPPFQSKLAGKFLCFGIYSANHFWVLLIIL